MILARTHRRTRRSRRTKLGGGDSPPGVGQVGQRLLDPDAGVAVAAAGGRVPLQLGDGPQPVGVLAVVADPRPGFLRGATSRPPAAATAAYGGLES